MKAEPIRRGLLGGAAAGAAMVALMYLLQALAGLRPLPELLQQPLLALIQGPLFGFLIDTLQHAGKVVEELSLIVGMILGLAVLGGVYGYLRGRLEVPHLAMLAAAFGWLAVNLVLLPLSGDGFLGADEGLPAPIEWALLFLAYAVVLEGAFDHWLAPLPADADPGRRRSLRVIPLAVFGGSLAVLGVQLTPGWYRSVFTPPEAGLAGPSPEITPVANFYVVSKNFVDPVVDAGSWSLNVHGLVDNPMKLTLEALKALPSATEYVTLECISNVVGGLQISTGQFTGVPLTNLLDLVAARSSATTVEFRSRDGYTESLPVALVRQSPEILVAHALDGMPLPDRHGFPARILVPGHYGMKGPKWVEDVQLLAGPGSGFWEGQGWNPDASVKTMARFDSPLQGALLKAGDVELAGIAFAGKRGISAVEFSADGGSHWQPATVKPPLSSLAWTLWTATWSPAAAGAYLLKVRARDGAGTLQPAASIPSFPDGAGGYHSVQVSVIS